MVLAKVSSISSLINMFLLISKEKKEKVVLQFRSIFFKETDVEKVSFNSFSN